MAVKWQNHPSPSDHTEKFEKSEKSGSGWDIMQEDKPNIPSSFINFLSEVTSEYHEL